MGGGVGVQQLPVGGHQLGGQQVVDRQAVFAGQVPDAAAEREPADADRGGVAESGGQPVGARRRGVGTGGQAGLGPRGAVVGFDVQSPQVHEVQDDAPLGAAVAGQAVATAAERQLEPALAGQHHRLGHLGRVAARTIAAGRWSNPPWTARTWS
jgi:hypothetical protein